MDLRKWFKKQGKDPKSSEGPPGPPASNVPTHRRPAPPLPKWAKKDSFERDRNSEPDPPPEDVAEEAMIKRPGAWLKQKIGGVRPEVQLQDLEKTKKIQKSGKNISDKEMEDFLSGYLNEEKPDEDSEAPPAEPGKKI
jgi:hypothetical protein